MRGGGYEDDRLIVSWIDFIQLHCSFVASVSLHLASASPTCNCFQRGGEGGGEGEVRIV
jgi:hypothetical protein